MAANIMVYKIVLLSGNFYPDLIFAVQMFLFYFVIQSTFKMKKNLNSIRIWISIFMFALVLSGVTAFAPQAELKWLLSIWPEQHSPLYHWLAYTYHGIKTTNDLFPAMAYGYDWLAFAHIVIATAFIGPLQDPVRNVWVIKFGCIACVMIFPLAFVAGYIRNIPLFWQLLDCSFSVIGLIPLWIIHRKIKRFEAGQHKTNVAYYNPIKSDV